jgi:uncharacterized protein YraI
VTTDRLNLRPGPGTEFNPRVGVVEVGQILQVVGRNEDSSWLQVAVLDANEELVLTGWVSTDFITCTGDVDNAPVVELEE